MKKKFILFGTAIALLLASCAGNPEGTRSDATDATEVGEAAGAEIPVDANASEVKWEGTKVTGSHYGTVDISSGKLFIDNDVLTGGEFAFDLSTIKSDDLEGEYKEKLEGHLKSDDFFDVENHPEATFVITNVTPEEENKLKVSGNLTIRGTSKNISFITDVTESNENKFDGIADFNIAREDWGVSYAGQADDLISKEINFKIHLVASK
ncbi:YceI family protein [Olivibacter sp. SDN3]|uniref:YceI family protein n=1 Tax=Olivibacter sp. SDN3 TaxID=2764720 RepID=UPI001651829C|nr:YceI family protein [Olivibacter sp. SDN3]QNL49163.1 YceI family protein [Olivibacter sp. SDN3]